MSTENLSINLLKNEVSIAFQTDKPIESYAKIGSVVENFGFDRITVYNDLLYQPAWLPLFQIADVTEKIILGPVAINPFTSHPVNIAGNIALLDEKSKGRSYLGIARGAWLDFIGIKHPKPIKAVKEAFICVDHLLKQDKTPLKAEFFPLEGGDTLRWEVFRSEIPFLLGSWGLKTAEMCYPYVSEIKLGGTVNPDMVEYFKGELIKIKNKLTLESDVGVVAGAVCVVDEDGAEAKEIAKKEVALYLPVIAELDRTLNIPQSIMEGINEAVKMYDYQTASEYISDDLLKKFAFAGTPEDIIKQSEDLFQKGAARIEYGTPHGLDMITGVNLLGNKVLPSILEFIKGLL